MDELVITSLKQIDKDILDTKRSFEEKKRFINNQYLKKKRKIIRSNKNSDKLLQTLKEQRHNALIRLGIYREKLEVLKNQKESILENFSKATD